MQQQQQGRLTSAVTLISSQRRAKWDKEMKRGQLHNGFIRTTIQRKNTLPSMRIFPYMIRNTTFCLSAL